MARKIIPINFENDPELYDYVAQHKNKADFIRKCIRSYKEDREVKIDCDVIEKCMERVMIRHLAVLQEVRVEVKEEIDNDIVEALNFFELDD